LGKEAARRIVEEEIEPTIPHVEAFVGDLHRAAYTKAF